MDISDLRPFARAAEPGNITHAAAKPCYTYSAASSALRRNAAVSGAKPASLRRR